MAARSWRRSSFSKTEPAVVVGQYESPALTFLVLFSASILVPLPATNTVPGFAVVVVAMGLLQRDGVLVLLGALLGTAWIATLIFAGASLASLIKTWIGL